MMADTGVYRFLYVFDTRIVLYFPCYAIGTEIACKQRGFGAGT